MMKKYQRVTRFFTVGMLGLLVLGACDGGSSAVNAVDEQMFATAPTSMTIEPNGSILTLGQSVTFVARDQNSAPLQVQWFTTNNAVASITSAGVVTARRVGRAVISARWGNQARYSTSVAVEVRSGFVVGSVAVTPTSATIESGATTQLSAEVRDANGVVVSFPATWSSSNNAVATVSSTGVVTGVAAGGATITATAGDRTSSASITVTAAPVPPTPTVPVVASVVVSPASATMTTGGTTQLVAQARDSAGAVMTGQSFTWSSTNTAVATVSSAGVVTAVAAGNATVRATSANGRVGSAAITVNAPPTIPPPTPVVATVAVTPASVTLTTGGSSQLSAQARDASGAAMAGVTLVWSSSNTAVATVSNTGVVTAVAAGSASVRATSSNGVFGSSAITVSAPPTIPPPSGSRQFIFTSDWSSETGATTGAKTDANRWNIISDPGNGLSVLTSCQSLGFPSATCLVVDGVQSATGFARLAKTGMPVPAAGESMFFRWYYRHEQPSLGDNSQHPIESGQNGGLDWCFNTETMSNTTWRPEFRTGGDQSNAMLARWTGPTLQQGVTYRFEMQIQKISNTELFLHVRVYDTAGNLIASDANFTNDRLGNTGSNARNLGMNPVLHFATNGGTNLHEIRAGVNGISNSDWFPRVRYGYQGGFAVCSGTWCGAYTPGEGR
jgi:uncharacterized protein YjdB